MACAGWHACPQGVVARQSAVRAVGAPIMVTWMRTPCRAYQHDEELSLAGMHRVGSCYRRLHGDELAGDAVRPRPRRAWWGAGLGRRSGGDWDWDDPSLPADGRCAIQLDRPDGMGVAEEVEQLELERDEVQELPMLQRPGSVGDGGAEEPAEHEQLSAGTAGRGRYVDGLGATRAWARALGWRSMGGNILRIKTQNLHKNAYFSSYCLSDTS